MQKLSGVRGVELYSKSRSWFKTRAQRRFRHDHTAYQSSHTFSTRLCPHFNLHLQRGSHWCTRHWINHQVYINPSHPNFSQSCNGHRSSHMSKLDLPAVSNPPSCPAYTLFFVHSYYGIIFCSRSSVPWTANISIWDSSDT